MALASRQFWSKKNSRPNFNKNNSSGTKGKQRVRTCYKCGNVLCLSIEEVLVFNAPTMKWCKMKPMSL